MDYKHNKSLVSNAKNLRKNMTKEERHLLRRTVAADVRNVDAASIRLYTVITPFPKEGLL